MVSSTRIDVPSYPGWPWSKGNDRIFECFQYGVDQFACQLDAAMESDIWLQWKFKWSWFHYFLTGNPEFVICRVGMYKWRQAAMKRERERAKFLKRSIWGLLHICSVDALKSDWELMRPKPSRMTHLAKDLSGFFWPSQPQSCPPKLYRYIYILCVCASLNYIMILYMYTVSILVKACFHPTLE